MRREFGNILISCPVCDSPMTISVPLLEWMEDRMPENWGSVSKKGVEIPDLPYPIGLDFERGCLVFLGWCPTCKKPGIASITPLDLRLLIDEGRREKGGDGIK